MTNGVGDVVLALLLAGTVFTWCGVQLVTNPCRVKLTKLSFEWATALERSLDGVEPAPGAFQEWPGVAAVQARIDRWARWERVTTVVMACAGSAAFVVWVVL
ncbi:hypothetical protein [Streptomyces alboflavus]|uniref:hypothetical protein n=1 Tax=Streptomyces alboflavus TaxID=67267 RepID=UPI0036CD3087